MDFDLNEDQRLLKDSVDRFVKDRYGFEVRSAARQMQDGWDRAAWGALADLGLLGLPFAEDERAGSGAGA